ncbi:hypothetical protein ACCD09_28505, partial [Variovorax sp. Varisp62]
MLVRVSKERPISYASHVDSHIYAFYTESLNGLYEAKLQELGLEENVMAFRALGKSNVDIAKLAFDRIKSRKKSVALALDITGFFDNLDHHILKISWQNLLNLKQLPKDHFNVFKSISKYSWVVLRPTIVSRAGPALSEADRRVASRA